MNIKSILGVIIGTTLVTTLGATNLFLPLQSAYPAKFINDDLDWKAPPSVSGENVYVAWWTNKTANNDEEIMFKASTDGGATFGDKINLSHTTNLDSWKAEIAAEGGNVIVTWWERNQTANEPVARVSNDNGNTFGPIIMLGVNGTITGVGDGWQGPAAQ
jgi:hypothetical protein